MENSWIEWTRKNVDIAEGYPKINSLAVTGYPWDDERRKIGKFENQTFRDDRLSASFAAVSPDAAEFAPRFTAIHYYFTLLDEVRSRIKSYPDWADADEWDIPDLESLEKALEEDLALLVGSLPVENVAVDWRNIQWEILNSYLICDWGRALELYDRAATVLEPRKLFLLRGQFRFLRVIFSKVEPHEGDGLESLGWEPRIFGSISELDDEEREALIEYSEDKRNSQNRERTPEQWEKLIRAQQYFINRFRLSFYSCCVKYPIQPIGDSGDRDWLIDAASDLKKAIEGGNDVPIAYHAIVGMSNFLRGEFIEAAEQYSRLLDCGDPKEFPPGRLQIFKSLALCYERATQTEKAVAVLQKCGMEFPEAETFLEIARLQSRNFKMKSVTDNIVKALELSPELSEDWKLFSLGWVGTDDATESLLDVVHTRHNEDPKTHKLVEEILRHYWEQFNRMTEDAKSLWIGGTYDLYYVPLFELSEKRLRFESAARFFTKALEVELREKVFAGFRDYIQRKGLQKIIEQGFSSRESEPLCGYLNGKPALSLGQMSRVLNQSLSSPEKIMEEFRRWREKHYPGLHKKLETLKTILHDRNAATHDRIAIENAQQVPSRCKEVFDALHRPAR